MTTVTNIDHATMKIIRSALDAKLAELSKELGIEITSGNARYGNTTGSFKIDLATTGEDGTVMTPEREAFLQLHHVYGLPKEALDAEITLSGHKLRIAGIKTKAPKNNIVLDCTDNSGRQMVAPDTTVLAVYKMQHVHALAG